MFPLFPFAVPLIEILAHTQGLLLRSMLSRLVETDELGNLIPDIKLLSILFELLELLPPFPIIIKKITSYSLPFIIMAYSLAAKCVFLVYMGPVYTYRS